MTPAPRDETRYSARSKPIDNVAFVLLDPAEARAHLPSLWLYELECWTIIYEVKTRLDTDEPPEGVGCLT